MSGAIPSRFAEPSRNRGSRRLRPACKRLVVPPLALLLFVLAAVVGCGKKGDPRPPILLVPAPTTDLTVVQRGGDLLVELAYPQTTAAGTPLPGLSELSVWQLLWRAPEPLTGPLQADDRRFLAGARPVRILEGEELAAAVSGDRIRLRLDVPEPEDEAGGAPVVTLAVKTAGPGGEESELSNRVTFRLVAPPAPPTDIRAEGEAGGVRLRWTHRELPEPGGADGGEAEDEAGEGEDESLAGGEGAGDPGLLGFNVYRRQATERTYGPPLRALGRRSRTFLDESVLFGESYIYTVTAVASRRPVVVESELAEEVEVVYRDVFPPPVPEGLVALSEGTRVRLVWEASEAPDLAGYRVYRRGPDTQEFRPLTEETVTGTDYTDLDLAAGATYTYQVTALDRLGNESEPSRPVTAAIR